MYKVVYAKFGDFFLSTKAKAEIIRRLGYEILDIKFGDEYLILPHFRLNKIPEHNYFMHSIPFPGYYLLEESKIERHNPILIAVIEELGEQANGFEANLEIKELKGNKYVIRKKGTGEIVIEPNDIEWIVI